MPILVPCSPGPPPPADLVALVTSSVPAPLCSRQSELHAALLMQTLGKLVQWPVTAFWVLFSFFPKNLLLPVCFFWSGTAAVFSASFPRLEAQTLTRADPPGNSTAASLHHENLLHPFQSLIYPITHLPPYSPAAGSFLKTLRGGTVAVLSPPRQDTSVQGRDLQAAFLAR